MKLEASELRIGNWLTYDDKPFQVGVWFFTELDARISYINDFEPIPFSEQMLMDLGSRPAKEPNAELGLFLASK